MVGLSGPLQENQSDLITDLRRCSDGALTHIGQQEVSHGRRGPEGALGGFATLASSPSPQYAHPELGNEPPQHMDSEDEANIAGERTSPSRSSAKNS